MSISRWSPSVIGFLIAFPAAVYASRHRWSISPITSISGVLYTIPAFAFIFLLLPITGLSLTTVAIPLIAYSLLILFRNTLAGLDSVEPMSRKPRSAWDCRAAAALARRGAARDAGDHRWPPHRDRERYRAHHDRLADRPGRVRSRRGLQPTGSAVWGTAVARAVDRQCDVRRRFSAAAEFIVRRHNPPSTTMTRSHRKCE